MKVDKIYVVHHPALTDRKQYMDGILPKFNIPFEYTCNFTQESSEIYDTKFIDVTESNRELKNSRLVGDKMQSNSALTLNNLKACALEHYSIISNFSKSDYDNIVILQDDIIFDDNFPGFEAYINDLPSDYDVVYLSNVCNTNLQYESNKLVDIQPLRISNGGGAYMVSKKAAEIIHNNSLPLYCNWDWEMNCIQMFYNMNVYWCTNFLLYDGSEVGRYKRCY